MGGLTHRLRGNTWLKPAQFGLVPVAVGLIGASGIIMSNSAGTNALSFAIIAVSTVFVWRTKRSPLWVLAGGGALGLALL